MIFPLSIIITDPETLKQVKSHIEIDAGDMEEMCEKIQAFSELTDKENLEHEDLLEAVNVIVEHPELVEFVKEVAPQEGQELGITDYLKIAKKAFQKFG